MVKRVLMIAFHFPPMCGSSAVQRTLKYCRYLLDHEWQPTVLTVQPHAHPQISNDQLNEIPSKVKVIRAFSFDTARHLSYKGRYLGFLAQPDRWVSWIITAIPLGLIQIFRSRPKVIWSTYPIATAHLIALILHKITKVPWVADFRDSMTEDDFPSNETTRKIYRWIERKTIENATYVVFTTSGAVRMYSERYPGMPETHWLCIPNGYDEENFQSAASLANKVIRKPNKIKIIHSGLIYKSERDPRPFFEAIAELKEAGVIGGDGFEVVLRASGFDDDYKEMTRLLEIDDIVNLEASISYHEAIAEMLTSDGLLIFQGSNCNHQIPGKIYEYLRAKKPIFALTDPIGDTANLLKDCGINTISCLDDKDQIVAGLARFIEMVRAGSAPIANDETISHYSRENQTKRLAALLDDVK